jgi:hypothetical protein
MASYFKDANGETVQDQVVCFVSGGAAAPVTPTNPLPMSSVAGMGAMQAVPNGTANGTALSAPPNNSSGVRFYLPTGASVTFTVAAAQPIATPSSTFTVSNSTTGPNWDENLAGNAAIYITATSGGALYRWY